MAYALRALVGGAILLAAASVTSCGSPSFTAAGGDGGASSDGSATGDGGASDSAAEDAAADANTNLNQLSCPGAPSATCDTNAKEVCCLYKSNNGGTVGNCQAGNQCQGNPPPGASGDATQLSCTRTRQCAGIGAADVCCITKPNGGNQGSSSCKTVTECLGSNAAVLCDTLHPECPGIQSCTTVPDANFGIAPPLGICK